MVDDCFLSMKTALIEMIRSGSGDMQSHLNQLGTDLKKLQTSLQELKETLQLLDIRINGGLISELPSNVQEKIKVQGQQLDAVLTQVQGLETVWAGVVAPNKSSKIVTTTYENEDISFAKGDEIGKFMMGSTVICLFEKNKIQFADLVPESHVLVGQKMAQTK